MIAAKRLLHANNKKNEKDNDQMLMSSLSLITAAPPNHANQNPFLSAIFYVILLFIILTVRFAINTYIVNGIPFSSSHFSHLLQFGKDSLKLLLYALPFALPVALILIWRQRGRYAVRLRKFLHFQLTVNGVATFVAFIAVIFLQQHVIPVREQLFVH